MKRRILVTMLAGAMILGLVACGTKETEKPADDTKVESTTNDATDEETVEEIVFTDENYDDMVAEHGVQITGKLIEEIESTEDDPLADCFVDEDGKETYLRQVFEYTDAEGNTYEVVEDYKNEKHEDIFFDVAVKDADGNILIKTIDAGMDMETNIANLIFFSEDAYIAHYKYTVEKAMAEAGLAEESVDSGEEIVEEEAEDTAEETAE